MTREENPYDILKEIDEKGNGLTDWEVNFLESLMRQKPKPLTSQQKKVMERIYTERVIGIEVER